MQRGGRGSSSTGSAVGGIVAKDDKIPFSAHLEREAMDIGASLAEAEYRYDVNPTKTNEKVYQRWINTKNTVVKNVESFMTKSGAKMYIDHIKVGETNFYSNSEMLASIRKSSSRKR